MRGVRRRAPLRGSGCRQRHFLPASISRSARCAARSRGLSFRVAASRETGLIPPADNETTSSTFATREQLLAALLILASANGLIPYISASIIDLGLWTALANTFGISAIVWAAWIAACAITMEPAAARPIRSGDAALAAVAVLLIAVPVTSLSWICLSGLAFYVFRTSSIGSPLRRAAPVFAALAAPVFWGPLFLQYAGAPLLKVDAFLVGTLLHVPYSDNVILYPRDGRVLQIFAACSSFHNMSQAAVAWVATNRALGRPWRMTDTVWCAAAIASAFAINLGRLSLMAADPRNFELVHGPIGAMIAGQLTLILIVLICVAGHRRDLFART